jgi:hypothetical protein
MNMDQKDREEEIVGRIKEHMSFQKDFEKSSFIWLGYTWAFCESGMISFEGYERIMALIPNAHYSEEYGEMNMGEPVSAEDKEILANQRLKFTLR